MEEFATDVSVPWVVMGDFNDITSSLEKFGGSQPSLSRCRRFNDMKHNCGLIDLGSQGPALTWCYSILGLAKVQEQLDRVMANSEWRLLFPELKLLSLICHD